MKIEFDEARKQALVAKIQSYMSDELGQTIGQFDAEFLLGFFTEQIGPHYYNRGLYDAQTVLSARIEDIAGAIDELEQPLA